MPLNLPQDVIDGHLDELKCAFEKGRIDTLFSAIRFCGNEGIPMPEWVVAAFFRATNAWFSMHAHTLDEAFGISSPTVKRFHAKQRRRKLQPVIYQDVERRHSEGENINTQLFASIGKKYSIGSTVASECYYEMRELLKQSEAHNAIDKLLKPFIVPGTESNRITHNTKLRAGRPSKKR